MFSDVLECVMEATTITTSCLLIAFGLYVVCQVRKDQKSDGVGRQTGWFIQTQVILFIIADSASIISDVIDIMGEANFKD